MPKLTKTIDRGWRDWYQLQRWRNRAKHQLQIEPTCRLCRARGRIVPATIADHLEPHRGDANKFWLGPLQSLCRDCHNGKKREQEREQERGYSLQIGTDGWPIDRKHPIYRDEPEMEGGP